ncbi:snaclec trimecetin subunit beta-like [Hyperolius riggenbachi]|uniref:snaclec trimecetin subunit beta-like n=1 Tax=Hyperolius riggenbachi TaxID=752182 RepID=UPI0035A36286
MPSSEEYKQVSANSSPSNGLPSPGPQAKQPNRMFVWCTKKKRVPRWGLILLGISVVIPLLTLIIVLIPRSSTGSTAPQDSAPLCPPGWKNVSNNCYFLSEQKMNWTASEAFCKTRGGSLMVINNNRTKSDFQVLTLKWLNGDDFCVGLRRDPSQNKWIWLDDTDCVDKVDYYQPGGKLDCAYLSDGKIRALDCSTQRPFICQCSLIDFSSTGVSKQCAAKLSGD